MRPKASHMNRRPNFTSSWRRIDFLIDRKRSAVAPRLLTFTLCSDQLSYTICRVNYMTQRWISLEIVPLWGERRSTPQGLAAAGPRLSVSCDQRARRLLLQWVQCNRGRNRQRLLLAWQRSAGWNPQRLSSSKPDLSRTLVWVTEEANVLLLQSIPRKLHTARALCDVTKGTWTCPAANPEATRLWTLLTSDVMY